MKVKLKYIVPLLFLFAIFGCEQDKDFPDTPFIKTESFERISEKDANWLISFTDGDGDFGTLNQELDSPNFITKIYARPVDDMDTTTNEDTLIIFDGQNYKIPAIRGIRTAAGIEGTIEIKIEGLDGFRISNLYDSVFYQGYVVDRSGKESNTIRTPMIDVN